MTDRTMLQFDYDEVEGSVVTAVLGKGDVAGRWSTIAIEIGSQALILDVDPDTDQISVSLQAWNQKQRDGWANVEPMREAVDATLGWCWIGRNYRGYLDMFTVSFSCLEPQFCFIAEASALSLKRVTELR